jgi:taurine dioxygenase
VSTGSPLGAEIRTVDLRALEPDDVDAIRAAWLQHQVLLFRGQSLTLEHLLAFSRHFGDLDLAPIQENGRRFVEGHPEIYVVSNVIENGVAIGSLGSGEAEWHSDMTYVENPPNASALYAVEVPGAGGETSFCSTYGAWERLSSEMRRRLEGLRLKHDATYNSGGYVRQGVVATDDPQTAPGVWHPLVRVHPETGRPALFLGRRRNAYIDGFSQRESEALLDELWAAATESAHVWTHRWKVGDLVLWDNRCTMHRRGSFAPSSRRVMYRTQIQGRHRSTSGV